MKVFSNFLFGLIKGYWQKTVIVLSLVFSIVGIPTNTLANTPPEEYKINLYVQELLVDQEKKQESPEYIQAGILLLAKYLNSRPDMVLRFARLLGSAEAVNAINKYSSQIASALYRIASNGSLNSAYDATYRVLVDNKVSYYAATAAAQVIRLLVTSRWFIDIESSDM